MADQGNFTSDNLIAGDFPRVTGWKQIPSGSLKRGTVITDSGAAMASGGNPYGVLSDDVDATNGAVPGSVYLTGEFAARHMILAGGAQLSDGDIANLRKLSIFAKKTVPAV